MCGELTFIDLGKIVSGNSYVFKSEVKNYMGIYILIIIIYEIKD